MSRVLKTIPLSNGMSFVTTGGNRYRLFDFDGYIKISEEQYAVPILGRVTKGMKRVKASLIVCENLTHINEKEFTTINNGKSYMAMAEIQEGNEWKKYCFDGLVFEEHDPVNHTISFDMNDLELIEKLLRG